MEMRISTDLDGLLDLIHDRWFDLTECVFDQGRREFRLSLSDRRKGPYRQKLLIVADVTDVAIRDEVQIQGHVKVAASGETGQWGTRRRDHSGRFRRLDAADRPLAGVPDAEYLDTGASLPDFDTALGTDPDIRLVQRQDYIIVNTHPVGYAA
ncbi:MAG: hypothetical protein WKH64_03730 [Chloroflexia bacterium]